MKKNVFLVLTCFFTINSATAKTPLSFSEPILRDKISAEASKNHHPLGYDQARIKLLGYMTLHQVQNSFFVTDVYCEQNYRSPGVGKLPNNSEINVEHTWPQSKFKSSTYKNIQKSDLHHLYPTDSELNSIRSSYPFGEVATPTVHTKCPESQFGNDSSGRRVFEPPQNHKGNVARAIFYFAIRYEMRIADYEEKTLRDWNISDPVDIDELTRNDDIQEYQGNRNPFIDQPELVNQITDF